MCPSDFTKYSTSGDETYGRGHDRIDVHSSVLSPVVLDVPPDTHG